MKNEDQIFFYYKNVFRVIYQENFRLQVRNLTFFQLASNLFRILTPYVRMVGFQEKLSVNK